jgi:hypothetical protein
VAIIGGYDLNPGFTSRHSFEVGDLSLSDGESVGLKNNKSPLTIHGHHFRTRPQRSLSSESTGSDFPTMRMTANTAGKEANKISGLNHASITF